MNSWSLPVSVDVVERPSLKVNAPMDGAELAVVVCTVQVVVEVLPICVVPLLVTTLIVAAKDFTLAIAVSSVVRSDAVSVNVRLAVPFDHVRAVSARYSVLPLHIET